MKKPERAALLFCSAFVVAILLLSLAACSSTGRHYEVPKDEFLQLANAPIGSVHDSQLIGVSGDRAYLRVWSGLPSSVGGGKHIYSVALADLSPEHRAMLLAGKDPWRK